MGSTNSSQPSASDSDRLQWSKYLYIVVFVALAVFLVTYGISAAGLPDPEEMEITAQEQPQSKLDRDPALLSKPTFPITLRIEGTDHILYTMGGTVGELLDRRNIKVQSPDFTRPSIRTELSPGIMVEVIRVSTSVVTEEIPIPYPVERIPSNVLAKGTEVVLQQGQDGARNITFEVTYENGEEVSRIMADETVLEEPVKQIVEYGIGGQLTTASGEVLNFTRKLDVVATAYTTEGYTNKITATGTIARVGAIAVDPKVIPYGSRLYITSPNGKSWIYGIATAEDCGGAIKGNKVDLFFNTRSECFQFGRRKAVVYVLESD